MMISLDDHIINCMNYRFKFGANDCVLFTGKYFSQKGAPVFKVIKKNIDISLKNWPKSVEELEAVASKYGFENISEMHISLIKKMGFKKAESPKNGDLILDTEKHMLGLGWKGGGAFLSSEDGIVVSNRHFNHRWTYS